MAVTYVESVVDIEGHGIGRGGVGGAIEIDHDPDQANQIATS